MHDRPNKCCHKKWLEKIYYQKIESVNDLNVKWTFLAFVRIWRERWASEGRLMEGLGIRCWDADAAANGVDASERGSGA